MSRSDRIMGLLDAMTQEERAEFFDEVAETYCTVCGDELPDADSDEPDHDCEEAEDEEGGDETVPDGTPADSDDEDDEDEVANEP